MRLISILLLSFLILSKVSVAQDTAKAVQPTQQLFDSSSDIQLKDTTPVIAKDSVAPRKHHDPHKATIRSAIIPGWGQAYNREYWKIPIVYGALSIPVVTYFYNSKWYNKTKFAYNAVYDATIGDGHGNTDNSRLKDIDPKLRKNDTTFFRLDTYETYRNEFRKNKDYSILYFIILWGANVIDATVFGHLKEFDVSDDLSLKLKPSFDPLTNSKGVGLVLNFKNASHKMLTVD